MCRSVTCDTRPIVDEKWKSTAGLCPSGLEDQTMAISLISDLEYPNSRLLDGQVGTIHLALDSVHEYQVAIMSLAILHSCTLLPL